MEELLLLIVICCIDMMANLFTLEKKLCLKKIKLLTNLDRDETKKGKMAKIGLQQNGGKGHNVR